MTDPYTQKKYSEQEMEAMLSKLPQHTPPIDLTSKIMKRLEEKPKHSFSNWCKKFISSLTLQPQYALLTIGVALFFFWIGGTSFTTYKNETQFEQIKNAKTAYYFGRGYLENDNIELAIKHFKKAESIDPANAEYTYWQGVAYWKAGDPVGEKESYLRGLQQHPNAYPILVNLGHNYLQTENYNQALESYKSALEIEPKSNELLLNIALAYNNLGDKVNEASAWKEYLANYRSGTSAFQAVQHLANINDYSYRTYQIGDKRLILAQDELLDASISENQRARELSAITKLLQNDPHLEVDIVVFMEGKPLLAKALAQKAKRAIGVTPDINNRVHLSWFDSPETILETNNNGYKKTLSKSILIFNRPHPTNNKEV